METNIDKLIRISLLLLLIIGSFLILAPFVILIIWGVIIAVAIYPLYVKAVKRLNGRKNLAAALFTIVGLSFILIPTILVTGSSATGYKFLSESFNQGTLTIPMPQEDVMTWPIIGEKVFSIWNLAAHNIKEFIITYSDELKEYGSWIVETLAGLGLTIIQFMISIIIAGALLSQAEAGNKTIHQFSKRLVGAQAEDFIKLIGGTIRSVVQGILGIALIQCFATAILLIISGIPFAGLWSVLVLVLAILQLPPLLVLGPIVIYVFSEFNTTPAVIFTVFAVLISVSDSLLKPVFLGRGVDIPMLVILIGAIGGMIAFGILGLFVGAVVLALSYKLMMEWVKAE
jgi:predicted PurR-regulated permease PerM